MDAALAALLGSAIGVFGTLGTTWLQQRHQGRREMAKIAADLAMADYARVLENSNPGQPIPPLSMFVDYHAKVLRAIAEDSFGPDSLREIEVKQRELLKVIVDGHNTGGAAK